MPKLSASQNYPTFKQLVVCGTETFASFKNKQNAFFHKIVYKHIRLSCAAQNSYKTFFGHL